MFIKPQPHPHPPTEVADRGSPAQQLGLRALLPARPAHGRAAGLREEVPRAHRRAQLRFRADQGVCGPG